MPDSVKLMVTRAGLVEGDFGRTPGNHNFWTGNTSRPSASAVALADLLGAEAADAVEAEGEDDAVFLAQADVETRKLDGRGAAVPRMPESHRRTDQRTIAFSGPL